VTIGEAARTGRAAWGRRLEAACFAAAGLALASKVALAAGAPAAWLTWASRASLASAVAAWALARGRLRWLDGHRLALLALALWMLPDVFPAVRGDGFESFCLLRSALIDRDLDLSNDFAGLNARAVFSPHGDAVTRFPIGMALLWAPGFAIVHWALSALGPLGVAIPRDGFAAPYQAAATTTTFAFGVFGLLLLDVMLRRWYDRSVALLSVLAVALATPLHFYLVANPFMSHAASAAAVTAFLWTWFAARDRPGPRADLRMGLAGGLMTLVRIQDAVLLPLPLLDAAWDGPRKHVARRAGWFALGAGLLGAVQLLVFLRFYGTGFAEVVRAQGRVGNVQPTLLDFLFAARHGAFTWMPLYAVGLLGLLASGTERRTRTLLALAFLASAVQLSTTGDWWGSDSFGQRRLLGFTAVIGLGLANALEWTRRRPLLVPAAGLAALAFWTNQFESIYNRRLVAPYNQAVSLEPLVGAQVGVLYETLLEHQERLPRRAFVLLYDVVKGVWLDEGARSLQGLVDLGAESEPGSLPQVVGDGWYPPESSGGVGFRLSRGPRSVVTVPIRTPGTFRLTLRARRGVETLAASVSPRINDARLEARELTPGFSEVSWEVAREVLQPGFNRIALVYSDLPRQGVPGFQGRNAAAAVDWLLFERVGPSPDLPGRRAAPADGSAIR